MQKEKIRVYTYTRVSTAMQVDGYSLDAQKAKMKAYADYNDYEIVGEYEDAGKSGKSIEGRAQFSQMMEDIKSGKDGVSYVLVFKLSRFGRNAADVLSSLQVMQDFGVNLVCVEDGIDSSKDAGKLMISVLSAAAALKRHSPSPISFASATAFAQAASSALLSAAASEYSPMLMYHSRVCARRSSAAPPGSGTSTKTERL